MMNNKDMFESHFLCGQWHVSYGFHASCYVALPSTRCGHSSYSFSLRYDLLLLGKDNALNCGWLSYAERSTCAGKSSHQARPGYSASPKICTYCSSSQTGGGYAAYYRQCAGDQAAIGCTVITHCHALIGPRRRVHPDKHAICLDRQWDRAQVPEEVEIIQFQKSSQPCSDILTIGFLIQFQKFWV